MSDHVYTHYLIPTIFDSASLCGFALNNSIRGYMRLTREWDRIDCPDCKHIRTILERLETKGVIEVIKVNNEDTVLIHHTQDYQ